MKFAINKEIVKSASKCMKNFECLSADDRCICPVEDCSEEKVHFIIPGPGADMCNYRMNFGYSYICNCPVRKEIYNQYRI